MEDKRFKEIMERLLARSGWEMLTAMRSNSMALKYKLQGAKEMEKVWHEIIREVMEEELHKKNA